MRTRTSRTSYPAHASVTCGTFLSTRLRQTCDARNYETARRDKRPQEKPKQHRPDAGCTNCRPVCREPDRGERHDNQKKRELRENRMHRRWNDAERVDERGENEPADKPRRDFIPINGLAARTRRPHAFAGIKNDERNDQRRSCELHDDGLISGRMTVNVSGGDDGRRVVDRGSSPQPECMLRELHEMPDPRKRQHCRNVKEKYR